MDEYPQLHHNYECQNPDCPTCLCDAKALEKFLSERTGTEGVDELGRYRQWLDNEEHFKHPETQYGWPDPSLYAPALLNKYIAYRAFEAALDGAYAPDARKAKENNMTDNNLNTADDAAHDALIAVAGALNDACAASLAALNAARDAYVALANGRHALIAALAAAAVVTNGTIRCNLDSALATLRSALDVPACAEKVQP